MNRRDFMKTGTASAFAAGISFPSQAQTYPLATQTKGGPFWPDGIKLVISLSMQMEAGAQPASGAESPMPPIDSRYPDIAAGTWYDYGWKEGLPRLLDMLDRRKVKVTSHMVGAAVDSHPSLAKEIVQRGHESSGHGQTWTPEYSMTLAEEREAYKQSIASIEKATGTRPLGFNAFWLRGTPNTLAILQELGFLYTIDNISRDEPFLIPVNSKPFAVVPYTLHMNDIVNYEVRHFSTDQFATDLKNEFDVLYEEAGQRRRMMSVSMHDRIAGRPSRMKVIEDFIQYAQSHPGVAFLRKDEIARFALSSPLTIREGF